MTFHKIGSTVLFIKSIKEFVMLSIVNRFSALVLCFSLAGCGESEVIYVDDFEPIVLEKGASIDNPDTVQLNAVAPVLTHGGRHGGGAGLVFSLPAIGIDNCKKTAAEIMRLAANNASVHSLVISCVPQKEGGDAVARFKCREDTDKQKNKSYVCQPLLLPSNYYL